MGHKSKKKTPFPASPSLNTRINKNSLMVRVLFALVTEHNSSGKPWNTTNPIQFKKHMQINCLWELQFNHDFFIFFGKLISKLITNEFSLHNCVSYPTPGCHPGLPLVTLLIPCWGSSSLGLCSPLHSTSMLPPVPDSSPTCEILNQGFLRVSSCVWNVHWIPVWCCAIL